MTTRGFHCKRSAPQRHTAPGVRAQQSVLTVQSFMQA